MRSVADIEASFDHPVDGPIDGKSPVQMAQAYLQAGEDIMLHWLAVRDLSPVTQKKEGFLLLAWQRQACKGDPSFNACRETCREIAYHYNLITLEPDHADTSRRLNMMKMVAKHLVLFIGGKMAEEKLGEFCCSSKVNRVHKTEIESLV